MDLSIIYSKNSFYFIDTYQPNYNLFQFLILWAVVNESAMWNKYRAIFPPLWIRQVIRPQTEKGKPFIRYEWIETTKAFSYSLIIFQLFENYLYIFSKKKGRYFSIYLTEIATSNMPLSKQVHIWVYTNHFSILQCIEYESLFASNSLCLNREICWPNWTILVIPDVIKTVLQINSAIV